MNAPIKQSELSSKKTISFKIHVTHLSLSIKQLIIITSKACIQISPKFNR